MLPEEFEPLNGRIPRIVLARHPEHPYTAMQTDSVLWSGIWNSSSGELEWSLPEMTLSCRWLPDGSELIVMLQKNHGHFFIERYSWPGKKLKCSQTYTCAAGQPSECDIDCLTVSPDGKYIAVRWWEQGCAGVDLMQFTSDTEVEILQSYRSNTLNILQGPAFSADSRYVVMTFSVGPGWWSPDEPDCASPGGSFKIGSVVILEVASGSIKVIIIEEEILQEWFPGAPDDPQDSLLSAPRFTADTTFEVLSPTGTKHLFAVDGSKANEHCEPVFEGVNEELVAPLRTVKCGDVSFSHRDPWYQVTGDVAPKEKQHATSLAVIKRGNCEIKLQELILYPGACVEDAAYTLQLQVKAAYTNCTEVPGFKWKGLVCQAPIPGERIVLGLSGTTLRQYFVFPSAKRILCLMMNSNELNLTEAIQLFDEIVSTLSC